MPSARVPVLNCFFFISTSNLLNNGSPFFKLLKVYVCRYTVRSVGCFVFDCLSLSKILDLDWLVSHFPKEQYQHSVIK